MKLTVARVFEALPLVTNIIKEKRPMPQKGAYRLARLHAKLEPEWALIAARRDDMIKAYDFPNMVTPQPSKMDPLAMGDTIQDGFAVPLDKLDEFNTAWAEIAKDEIEVDVQPIPLAQLDLGGDNAATITALELVVLGDLVAE